MFEPEILAHYYYHLLLIQPLQLFDELRNKHFVDKHLLPQPG